VAFAELHLGELAWNAGDLPTAARHYAAARRADPTNLPALAGLARVTAARGGDATVAYATIADEQPTTGYVVEYGELLAAAGRVRDARAQFEVARAGHRLLAAQGVAVDLEQALFEADHGDPAAALTAARSVWRTRRGIFAADAYAWALHANGRDREALRYADRALRLGTRNALLHFHRGAILHALGRAAAARAEMRTALRINPYFSYLHAPSARRLAR
jgi:tetratricopeptide (TPR) repeat protein